MTSFVACATCAAAPLPSIVTILRFIKSPPCNLRTTNDLDQKSFLAGGPPTASGPCLCAKRRPYYGHHFAREIDLYLYVVSPAQATQNLRLKRSDQGGHKLEREFAQEYVCLQIDRLSTCGYNSGGNRRTLAAWRRTPPCVAAGSSGHQTLRVSSFLWVHARMAPPERTAGGALIQTRLHTDASSKGERNEDPNSILASCRRCRGSLANSHVKSTCSVWIGKNLQVLYLEGDGNEDDTNESCVGFRARHR